MTDKTLDDAALTKALTRAHHRGEGPAADRTRLLEHLADREDRAAPHPGLRRSVGRARRDVGRAGPLAQPALGDRSGLGLGPGHRPSLRRGGRGRGPSQGRRRRARPHHQPAPLPAQRQALRVLQRGPRADRRPRRGVRARRAGQRCRRHPEALHRQRLRDRPLHRRRPGRRTTPARALPAGLREGDHRGAGLAGDELLQLRQRRHRDRERPARDAAQQRVGLRRCRDQRLDGRAQPRQRPRVAGPGDARTRRPVGRRPSSRPSSRATSTSRSWTARCCASCGWRSASAPSPARSVSRARARRGRSRVRPRGGRRGHGPAGEPLRRRRLLPCRGTRPRCARWR